MIEIIFKNLDVIKCLLGALIILMAILHVISPKNLPPTPGLALPFIGHLYMLEKNPRRQFKQWADKYGDVFRLQIGSKTAVFVNTFDAMKEAFVQKGDHFSDRYPFVNLELHFPDFISGILLTSGAKWKAQRTTSLSILKHFWMGKNILAEKISEEVLHLIKELETKKGCPIKPKYLINISISNIISSIIIGKRFDLDDPKFNYIIRKMAHLVGSINGLSISNYLPSVYYLPFDLFGCKKLLNNYSDLHLFFNEIIETIKKSYNPNNLDNFVVAYIDAMIKEKQSTQESYLNEQNLYRIILDLFIAGTETTSTTILWCLFYVLNYPDVQKKIFDEILEQVGTERSPEVNDKSKLKYLSAFLLEVQRKASTAPLSLPHLCSHDSTIAGYSIPKGAIVVPHLDAVHSSKEIWGDPENFRPERFLDEQCNIVTREELIPFSIGRRVCLGESLAKMELFLFMSTLFQKFELLLPSPDDIPPFEEVFGIGVAPKTFKIKFLPRTVSL